MAKSSSGRTRPTVWRLLASRHADDAFDGEGARRYGGRWNHSGTPMVYASSSLSLAALELFVHLEPENAPLDLVAIAASLPAGMVIPELTVSELPEGWRSFPATEGLREIGTAWAQSAESLALWVPSAVIPSERNLLLNPRHADSDRIRVESIEPFYFDPRMWKPEQQRPAATRPPSPKRKSQRSQSHRQTAPASQAPALPPRSTAPSRAPAPRASSKASRGAPRQKSRS